MKLGFSLRRKKKGEDDEAAAPEQPSTAPVEKGARGAAIKKWLFLHAEKLVLAAVVAILAWMVSSGLGKLEVKSDHTPTELAGRVQQIRTKINESPFPEEQYPVPDFVSRASEGYREVPTEQFTFGSLAGEIQGPGRRPDPDLFAAQRLEAKAGHGVFYVKQQTPGLQGIVVSGGAPKSRALPQGFKPNGVLPPAEAQSEGRRWVSVNAIVPFQRQVSQYTNDFAPALGYDPNRDIPRYSHMIVQRLEVRPGQPQDWSQAKSWEFDEDFRKSQEAGWALRGPQWVESQYLDLALSQRLGPLANKSWNTWATHSQVPLAPPKPTTPATRPGIPGRGRPQPGFGRNQNVPRPGMAADADEGEAGFAPPTSSEPSTYKLVRFFDFDVQPGRFYRYRVQLVLQNPNSISTGLPPHFLDNPDSLKVPTRSTDWSAPSAVVRVPDDAEVLADRIEMPSGDMPEPLAHAVIRILEVARGKEPIARLAMRRGAPIRGIARTLLVDVAERQMVVNESANIVTEFTLIDFHGGKTLGMGGLSPAEMLLMDNRGNLVSRNSAEDAAALKPFQKLESALTQAKPERPTPGVRPGKPKNPLFDSDEDEE